MKIPFTLLFLFSYFTSISQTTITIGSGTANSLYGPIYIFSSTSPNTHSWNLAIYNQADILSAGGYATDFNSISWYKTDTSSYPVPDATFEIFIKHTSMSGFSSAANFDVEVIGATQVYSNVYQSIASVSGWIEFPFQSSFSWNGTDNIMVLTRWVRNGNATGSFNWQSTTAPSAMVSHSFNSTSTMGSLYTTANLPNIMLELGAPVSIEDASIDQKTLKIFPNPAGDFIMVRGIDDNAATMYSVYDISGREILNGLLPTGNRTKIQLPGLSNGMYILQLKNEAKLMSGRFVITY